MNLRSKTKKGIVYLHWLNGITTFNFAILFSSLSLYLTKSVGLSETQSNSIVGFFLAANFILHFISGYIGDRWLSNRLLLTISIMIQAVGVTILNFTSHLIYLGLSLFLIGCGFAPTCINCLITLEFAKDEDQLREKTFFYNYSAMNVGFLSGYLLSGIIDIKDKYTHLFNMSNLANLIMFVFIMKSWSYFAKETITTKEEIKQGKKGIVCVLLIIPILFSGFYFSWLADSFILIIGTLALLYSAWLGYNLSSTHERKKYYSFLFLTVSSIVFWMLYYVGPMGVTEFLKYNVDIHMGSYYIPPQWFMNLNALFVIIGSPLLLQLFEYLRKKQINISIPKQFIGSLVFIALSFLSLTMGILGSNTVGLVNLSWILIHYIFLSIGELLIAPVGYAMIGHLAPPKLQGFMMGIWMMVSGIAVTLSNYFSSVMTKSESMDPLISNTYYASAFTQLGLYAFLGALFLWLFSKTIENNIKS